jgi:hypothetical protein
LHLPVFIPHAVTTEELIQVARQPDGYARWPVLTGRPEIKRVKFELTEAELSMPLQPTHDVPAVPSNPGAPATQHSASGLFTLQQQQQQQHQNQIQIQTKLASFS